MFIKTLGQGPDLVMLHGWSMHSGVWHQFADILAERFTLHLVDLPGHGQSDWQAGALQLDVLVEQLSQRLTKPAYWLGWSLGGLIATALAKRYPKLVDKLILVAATPCFVEKQDWPCAVKSEVFTAFADNLHSDQQQTLKRFLMLQARGAEHSKQTIRQLADDMAATKPPMLGALQQGLELLLNIDLRDELAQLSCPVQVILGERDTLVPADVLSHLSLLDPSINTQLIAAVGHAPFIAKPKQCAQLVIEFIDD